MTIPDKQIVIKELSNLFGCSFYPMKRKQIIFEGMKNGKRIVVCTPSSKIHVNGNDGLI